MITWSNNAKHALLPKVQRAFLPSTRKALTLGICMGYLCTSALCSNFTFSACPSPTTLFKNAALFPPLLPIPCITFPWFNQHCLRCFPGGTIGKEAACNAGDWRSIPGSWRSPGEGNGNPPQYSCLGNPMDRGACRLQSMGLQRVGHD